MDNPPARSPGAAGLRGDMMAAIVGFRGRRPQVAPLPRRDGIAA